MVPTWVLVDPRCRIVHGTNIMLLSLLSCHFNLLEQTLYWKLLPTKVLNQTDLVTIYQGCFFQFCDVAKLVIIHKKIQPNLARDQKWKQKSLRILLYFGYLLEPFVKIWRHKANFYENPLYVSKSYFSGKKSENLPLKK